MTGLSSGTQKRAFAPPVRKSYTFDVWNRLCSIYKRCLNYSSVVSEFYTVLILIQFISLIIMFLHHCIIQHVNLLLIFKH